LRLNVPQHRRNIVGNIPHHRRIIPASSSPTSSSGDAPEPQQNQARSPQEETP
jgi:hypothetical protein